MPRSGPRPILPRVNDSLRIIRNARPGVDWNTCGQAAAATLLAHFRVGPFAAGAPADDGAAVDAIRATHPPDVPLALGTTSFRLAAALFAHGLEVERVHSGLLGWGFPFAYDRLRRSLDAGRPAIVLVDDGRLGGRAFQAHWAVLSALDAAGARLDDGARHVSLERFVDAWACPMLPFTHNHCALLARPR